MPSQIFTGPVAGDNFNVPASMFAASQSVDLNAAGFLHWGAFSVAAGRVATLDALSWFILASAPNGRVYLHLAVTGQQVPDQFEIMVMTKNGGVQAETTFNAPLTFGPNTILHPGARNIDEYPHLPIVGPASIKWLLINEITPACDVAVYLTAIWTMTP